MATEGEREAAEKGGGRVRAAARCCEWKARTGSGGGGVGGGGLAVGMQLVALPPALSLLAAHRVQVVLRLTQVEDDA